MTRSRVSVRLVLLLFACLLTLFGLGCSRAEKDGDNTEEEPIARTEFTERIENFFEYDPLKAGKQSQFLIHLTDLTDGSPVEKAEVVLTIRKPGGGPEIAQTKARIGKVTGIYVADIAIASAGDYAIEFHVKNPKLDERMQLTDFKVE
jgi:hypothetical protein